MDVLVLAYIMMKLFDWKQQDDRRRKCVAELTQRTERRSLYVSRQRLLVRQTVGANGWSSC